jgi:Viral BACON domain
MDNVSRKSFFMQICLRCQQPCESDKGFCEACYASLLAYANHDESAYQPVPLLPLGAYPHTEIQPHTIKFAKETYWNTESPQAGSPIPLELLEPTDKPSGNFMREIKQHDTINKATVKFSRTRNRSHIYIPLSIFCVVALLVVTFTQLHLPILQTQHSAGDQSQNAQSQARPQSSQYNDASSSTPALSSSPAATGSSGTQAIASTPGSTQTAASATPQSNANNTTISATPTIPGSTPVSTQPATSGTVTIAPTSLSAVATQGQGNPAQTSITITNTENRNLSWQAGSSNDWLKLTSDSGTTAAGQSTSLPIGYNSAGLTPGSYHAQIQITMYDAASASPVASQNIAVTLTIALPCSIQVAPASLTFTAILLQKNSQSKNITLTGSGGCNYPISWRASSDSTWLVLASNNGTDTGAGSTLSVNVQGQTALLKTYTGSITFSAVDNNGANVSVNTTVTVKFTVIAG